MVALADEPIGVVYASDLSRAWQTAKKSPSPMAWRCNPSRGLRERASAHFEGLTFAEIEAALPEQAKLWRERDPEFAPRRRRTCWRSATA